MITHARQPVRLAVGELAAVPTSAIAFGGIAVLVSAGVFLGPYIETRRRAASVRTALLPSPTAPNVGYRELLDAEQRRVYRVAVLMTGRPSRATAIVEETFARTLQQWTRLPADARVWFVLSTDIKLCIGSGFVRSLGHPLGTVASAETDELVRAAETLSVLEPTRRAIVILSQAEALSDDEVARVVGTEPGRVRVELQAGLQQLGPTLAAVAA